MPTTDDRPTPPARRPLGRGPGTQPRRRAADALRAPGGGSADPALKTRTARSSPAGTEAPSAPASDRAAVSGAGTRRPGRSGGQARPAREADPAPTAPAPPQAAAEQDRKGQDRKEPQRHRTRREQPGSGSGGPQDAPPAEPGEAGPDKDGAQPAAEGGFQVRLDNFEGPFDLLLQLIAKHKLDVTEVALSKVTDEFIAHIRAMGPEWDLNQATEFLVVAATLLDLKAARLLPSAEVEDEEDLALLEARDLLFARLLQYRAYKQVAAIFADRLEAEARHYPRTVGLEPHHAELLPEVVMTIGPEEFARLAAKAMAPKPEPVVYVEHIHAPLVSVREQAGILVERLRRLGTADFRTLTEDAADTLTVVARFLALLELYRERAVALEQEEPLGRLLVRWTGGDGDFSVTAEFDQADAGGRRTEERGRREAVDDD